MFMLATILEVWSNRLLVRDHANSQNVIVNTNVNLRCFFPGDTVTILYNGVMTKSIPPQIFGLRIFRLSQGRNCR